MKKLAPWNWQKHEDREKGKTVPTRSGSQMEGHPLFPLHHEIDRLFTDAFRGFSDFPFGLGRELATLAPSTWLQPTMDIAATEKEYTVTLELPGVDEKEIHLEITADTLKIEGEKKQEKEEKEKNYYRVERSYGSFLRTLSLPDDADRDAIQATFKQGVMKISIPRKTPPKPESKKIEIKAG